MTFPREGKFTSSHFFASKDVMGSEALLLGNHFLIFQEKRSERVLTEALWPQRAPH